MVKASTHRVEWPGEYFPNKMAIIHDSLKAKMVVNFQYQNHIAKMAGTLYIQLKLATDIQDNYELISRLIIGELEERKIDMNNK